MKIKERSSLFLVANLGSEIARYFQILKKNGRSHREQSLERIKKLLLDIDSCDDMKIRRKEFDALLPFIKDASLGTIDCNVAERECQTYFYPIALRFMER